MSDGDTQKTNRKKDAGRVLMAGSLNALLTLALYQLLLFSLSPELAYAIAWILSLAAVALTYPKIVFPARHLGWQGHAVVGLIYVAAFLLGMGILRTVIELTGLERAAIFASIPASALLSVLGMRMVFRSVPQH